LFEWNLGRLDDFLSSFLAQILAKNQLCFLHGAFVIGNEEIHFMLCGCHHSHGVGEAILVERQRSPRSADDLYCDTGRCVLSGSPDCPSSFGPSACPRRALRLGPDVDGKGEGEGVMIVALFDVSVAFFDSCC
jgi:hypothetical protein